mmetsp:Transcript_28292/g.24212  ORF Transcript_28292/g.24212 Transcript_28292/m.24212 type:complete len:125 (-) Transcript_28292:18-392(-)
MCSLMALRSRQGRCTQARTYGNGHTKGHRNQQGHLGENQSRYLGSCYRRPVQLAREDPNGGRWQGINKDILGRINHDILEVATDDLYNWLEKIPMAVGGRESAPMSCKHLNVGQQQQPLGDDKA